MADVIAAAPFHAKYQHITVVPAAEVSLYSFINTVCIADHDREPFVDDLVDSELDVLVQPRETP
jgi:hypothetical protein